MYKLIGMLLCVFLAGCDYNVPLVKTPGQDIDPTLVGLWQRSQENNQTEQLLILPLSKQEYLVSYPAHSKNALFARACLCQRPNLSLVQLEWFGTAQGSTPEDSQKFQFAEYSLSGTTLTVRLLNTDLIKKDVKTSVELAKSIDDNQKDPALFKNEMVFIKAKTAPIK